MATARDDGDEPPKRETKEELRRSAESGNEGGYIDPALCVTSGEDPDMFGLLRNNQPIAYTLSSIGCHRTAVAVTSWVPKHVADFWG